MQSNVRGGLLLTEADESRQGRFEEILALYSCADEQPSWHCDVSHVWHLKRLISIHLRAH
jgi:hypothetical protein